MPQGPGPRAPVSQGRTASRLQGGTEWCQVLWDLSCLVRPLGGGRWVKEQELALGGRDAELGEGGVIRLCRSVAFLGLASWTREGEELNG